MTTNIKLLFAVVAALGLALGYYANSRMVGSMMALRTIGMACTALDAAERAGQMTKQQGDEIFAAIMKTLDKGISSPADDGRQKRCAPSA